MSNTLTITSQAELPSMKIKIEVEFLEGTINITDELVQTTRKTVQDICNFIVKEFNAAQAEIQKEAVNP